MLNEILQSINFLLFITNFNPEKWETFAKGHQPCLSVKKIRFRFIWIRNRNEKNRNFCIKNKLFVKKEVGSEVKNVGK